MKKIEIKQNGELIDTVFEGQSVMVGDTYISPVTENVQLDGYEFIATEVVVEPVEPDIVISRRQFFYQLEALGMCTLDELIEVFKTGTLPAFVQQVLTQIPDEEARKRVEVLMLSANDFHSTSATSDQIKDLLGWTTGQKIQFFQQASKLV